MPVKVLHVPGNVVPVLRQYLSRDENRRGACISLRVIGNTDKNLSLRKGRVLFGSISHNYQSLYAGIGIHAVRKMQKSPEVGCLPAGRRDWMGSLPGHGSLGNTRSSDSHHSRG